MKRVDILALFVRTLLNLPYPVEWLHCFKTLYNTNGMPRHSHILFIFSELWLVI